jgi:hypothetical protein
MLTNQAKIAPVPQQPLRVFKSRGLSIQLDQRYVVLWHALPPVAAFLQRESWQSLLLWLSPMCLAACTVMAESDAHELDFTLVTLKSQKYDLKGA